MKQDITPLTVSQLNRQVRSWLEYDLGDVNVFGELSNLSKPASGHWYFTLKDQFAQLRCVFFRNYHKKTSLKDGQQVIAKGKLSLYEARGDYQLVVHELVESGDGVLYQQFEQLKLKLEQQGLFDAAHKKPLCRFPSIIAVITSASGAALHDILITLNRRYPIAEVHVYPCDVQGNNAASQLIDAIKAVNQAYLADVIIIARGGGSIEDLWAFNQEQLALSIYQSAIPIVSGIGHETDFTIADFVADKRAATPTAAAEAVTPDKLELLDSLNAFYERIGIAIERIMRLKRLLLSHLLAKIDSPQPLIANYWQHIDYAQRQLNQQTQQALYHTKHRIQLLLARLDAKNPQRLVYNTRQRLHYLQNRLADLVASRLHEYKQLFHQQLATLHAVSPLATLNRGYAIATHHHTILVSHEQVNAGDMIELTLAKGHLSCAVLSKTIHQQDDDTK